MSAQNGPVQRLWSYCNILRDDGLSYGGYLEPIPRAHSSPRARPAGLRGRARPGPASPASAPSGPLAESATGHRLRRRATMS
jgi:hypothetical protein